jgi:hypothetical protein
VWGSLSFSKGFLRHLSPSIRSQASIKNLAVCAKSCARLVTCSSNERVAMTKASTLFFRGLTATSRPRLQICGRNASPWQLSRWTRSSSTGQTFPHHKPPLKPFWSSGRVLLFAGFASTLAYAFGVTDAGTHVDGAMEERKGPEIWKCQGSREGREHHIYLHSWSYRYVRLSRNYEVFWAKIQSVLMMKT